MNDKAICLKLKTKGLSKLEESDTVKKCQKDTIVVSLSHFLLVIVIGRLPFQYFQSGGSSIVPL